MYYALPLPRHPLSVGTFLSLSPSTKPLATKFKTGPPGSNPTYFRFSPSKKTMNWQRSVFWEVTICHAHPPKNVTFCDCRLRGGAKVVVGHSTISINSATMFPFWIVRKSNVMLSKNESQVLVIYSYPPAYDMVKFETRTQDIQSHF